MYKYRSFLVIIIYRLYFINFYKTIQQKYLEQTRRELKLRNYSFKIIKAYLGCLKEYIDEENIKLLIVLQEKKLKILLRRSEIQNIN